MSKFTTNTTYTTRLAGDHTMIWEYTVIDRTAKTITIIKGDDTKPKRVKIHTDENGEWALPDGRYSMAPTLRA